MNTAQATDVTANLKLASPEIMEMHSLITKMGFIMMGATHIRFSNQQYLLSWLMGSGAMCVAINMFTDPVWICIRLTLSNHIAIRQEPFGWTGFMGRR